MVVSFIGLNIVFILLYNKPCLSADLPASGAFVSRIQNVTVCENPTRPYIKNSPLIIKVETYNTTDNIMLRGNVTITRNIKNVKHKARGFLWKNNQWKPNFIVNEFQCHGMFLHFLYVAFSVKYDRKNCMYLKGKYFFKDVDVNTIGHLWSSSLDYGLSKFRYEMLDMQLGTYFCNYFYMMTEPSTVYY